MRKPQVPLTAPTGINATAGNGQATISWNAVSGASSYNLYMASVTGVTKNNYISLTSGVKGTGVTSPFIQTGLPNGTAHYFVVTAINANGESSESSQVSATPQAGIPIVYQPSNDIGVQDIWTTSIYSYAPGGGGPGGGLNDERLRVGGSSDLYYSLIQFDLSQLPPVGLKVELQLYMPQVTGAGTTGLYVDRVTAFWDWRTQGTGQDRLRLWWANRPSAIQWIPNSLPAPIAGQWYVIDITTLYNAWQAGTYPNYGVQLRPVTNSNTWADFSSSNSVDALHHPRLVVTTITTTLPAGYVVQGGLTWMPVTFDLNWTNANAYCANTTINGQTGWRLPTQAEANAFSSSFGSIGGFYNPLWASPSMPSIWTSTPASGGSHYFANILTGFGFDVFDVNLLGVPCVR